MAAANLKSLVKRGLRRFKGTYRKGKKVTPAEFILAIEEYWSPLKPKNQRLYVHKIGRFNRDQLDTIYDKLLENCQWTPKIKAIFDAALDLGFLQESKEQRTLGRKRCSLCEGTGWQYITEAVTMPDGVTFQPDKAVVRCECRKRGVETTLRAVPKGGKSPHLSASAMQKTILRP